MALKSYEEMRQIDVKPYCEERDGLTYLNWAKCIDLLHENVQRLSVGTRSRTKRPEVVCVCRTWFSRIQKEIQTDVMKPG